MQTRKVHIELIGNSYFVLYVNRKKFGRHFVAQFDARYTSLLEIKEYIKARPYLELVEVSQ